MTDTEQTTFTVLTETDNGEDWPDGCVVITSIVEGHLADLIRAKLDVHPRTPVVIEEMQTQGGYSEYTQENDFDFELRVGDQRIELPTEYYSNAVGALTKWLEGTTPIR